MVVRVGMCGGESGDGDDGIVAGVDKTDKNEIQRNTNMH